MSSPFLLINDPLYGFIRIPRGLLTDIISHPYFQRLGRIRQLGMTSFVYPGAQHTRFSHSLGAFHLMRQAVHSLQEKGVFLFDTEVEAASAAILLHDVGHGPFSHVLEHIFSPSLSHEDISLRLMERMNREMEGRLTLAVKVFQGEYGARYLHELISSQIDVDRLDYLCRDSFYTGVREGNVGAARIIKLLEAADDRLAVNIKGLNSVENYLMSRRVMYWQVYLHKTVVGAEEVLRQALRRAKHLAASGHTPFAPPALRFFLEPTAADVSEDVWLDHYVELEDADILSAVKAWCGCDDLILSRLSEAFVRRRLFRSEVFDAPIPEAVIQERRTAVASALGIAAEDADYFVQTAHVGKELYRAGSDPILMRLPDGTLRDVAEVSPLLAPLSTASPESKHYLLSLRM